MKFIKFEMLYSIKYQEQLLRIDLIQRVLLFNYSELTQHNAYEMQKLYVYRISNNNKIFTLITKSKPKDKHDKQKTWLKLHFFYTKHNFLASIYTTL